MATKKLVGIAPPSIPAPPVIDMGRVVEVPVGQAFVAAERPKGSLIKGAKR